MTRKPFSRETKSAVWSKTDGHCWYCGRRMTGHWDYTIDHVVPVVRGGTDDLDNLVPCCRTCNCSKGAGDYPILPRPIPDPRELRLPDGGHRGYHKVIAPEGCWTLHEAMTALDLPYAVIDRWARTGAVTTIRLGSRKNSPRAFRKDEVRAVAESYQQARPPTEDESR